MYRNLGKRVATIVLSALLFGSVSGIAMVGVGRAAQFATPRNVAAITENSGADVSQSGTVQNNSSQDASAMIANGSQNTTAVNTASSTGTAKTVSEIAQDAMPQVVSITNTIRYKQYGYTMFGLGGESEAEAAASGSGVIVGKTDSELLIATNHHVIEDSTTLSVQFVDGTSADAQVKGEDSDADLAVIAVKLSDIPSETLSKIEIAEFGDSDALQVGDQVVAIGNALGYGQSVTTGIISAKNRDVETSNGTEAGLLQTDAAINPGNSGGARCRGNGILYPEQ